VPQQSVLDSRGRIQVICTIDEKCSYEQYLLMSANSKIEWTDATWNPVRGCTKISPGCKHCYAETFAERFKGVAGHPFEHGFKLRLVPEKLADPIRWRTPRKIFVNSMSDLFHPDVPDAFIENVCRVMIAADWHTYQVLTKRADRMSQLLQTTLKHAAQSSHIWWGVSVEDRSYGLPRVELLQRARPSIAFLSVEPLIEELGPMNLENIHWVIVGGESGPGARPMEADWVRSIRSQCKTHKIPFFFKQWGGVRKSRTGRMLDGRTYDRFPAARTKPVPSDEVRSLLLEDMAFA
jgi:protein gp37